MDNYRMTISRDRLAEFRRNSAIISASNGANHQLQQQQRRISLGPQHVSSNYHSHHGLYQPPLSTLSHYASHNEKYSLSDSYNQRFASAIQHQNTDLTSTEAFFQKIEDIKGRIAKINENITEIESLRSSALSSIDGEHSGQVNYALENLVNQTSKLNRETKNCIKETELSNAKLSLNPSDQQMRSTQLQALKKRFVETIQRYQDIERIFEKKQRQRIERQILIVKPEATPQEIEMAIDSDDPPQIFAHSLLNLSRTGSAIQVLDEVQTRRRDIKKIEKTILELHQLFLDMQQMVEIQQETIVNIEKSTEGTNYELEQGNKSVTVAVSTAKSTRKRKWLCFIIFVIVLAVTGILIWWFAFPKSRPTTSLEVKIVPSINGSNNSTIIEGASANVDGKQTTTV